MKILQDLYIMSVFDRIVDFERKGRSRMCFEYFSEPHFKIARSLLQSCQDFLLFFVAAEYANVNDGCLQVRRRLDLGHFYRRFLDSRVLDLLTEQQTQLPLNLTVDPFDSMCSHVVLLSDDTQALKLSLDRFHDEGFDRIPDLDVVETVDSDPAFVALGDILDVVLETAKRSDLAFEDNDPVANDSDFVVSRDLAVGNVRAGDDLAAGILNVSRTSAVPVTFSTNSGSSIPSIACLTSSIAS